MSTASKVTLAVADGVAIISLNRPDKHNAVDDELHEEFVATWAQVTADPAARVILLRGEGRSFCSGRDTAALGRGPSQTVPWRASGRISSSGRRSSTRRSRSSRHCTGTCWAAASSRAGG